MAGALAAALALGAWMLSRPAPPASGVLDVSGQIEGDQAAIGARVGGKIVRLAVREGDRVAAGQPFAELGSEEARAQLEQAEHALHTARELMAAQQLDEARIQSAAAGVKVARANLDDTRVAARFSGTVLTAMVEMGEVVAALTPLVTLAPAARSGIRPGDVIVAFQGKPIRGADELPRLTAKTPPGSDAELKVRRGGAELAMKVRLGEPPEAPER